MAFFRQYIAPFLVVLVFLVALIAVSARIFLPADMAAPAPSENVPLLKTEAGDPQAGGTLARLSPGLSVLIHGLPDDPASEQM